MASWAIDLSVGKPSVSVWKEKKAKYINIGEFFDLPTSKKDKQLKKESFVILRKKKKKVEALPMTEPLLNCFPWESRIGTLVRSSEAVYETLAMTVVA